MIFILEATDAGAKALEGLRQAGLLKMHAAFTPESNGASVAVPASVGAGGLAPALEQAGTNIDVAPATDVAPPEESFPQPDVDYIRPIPGLVGHAVVAPALSLCNLCMGTQSVPGPGGEEGQRETCPRCHGAGVADPAVCCGDRCACH